MNIDIPDVTYDHVGLSIKQPAASLIVDGHKPVENRKSGQFKHDTLKDKWICIHASLGNVEDDSDYPVKNIDDYRNPKTLPRGKIIGMAHIKGVYKQSELAHDVQLMQWAHDGACIVFDTIIKLDDPVDAPGGLSFWKLKPAGTWKPPTKPSKKELTMSKFDVQTWRDVQKEKYYKQSVKRRIALCNIMLAIRQEKYSITYNKREREREIKKK